MRRGEAFEIGRRARYKADLEGCVALLERGGVRDGALEEMRDRLACIEWLESRRDPRPLDSGTMAEFRRSRSEQEGSE